MTEWTICTEHLIAAVNGACPECKGDRNLVVVVVPKAALDMPREALSRADVAREIVADLRDQTNPGGIVHDIAAIIEREWVYGDKGKER